MPLFPSKEWCAEAVRLIHEDAESAKAGAGWRGDFGVVVDAEQSRLARPFTLHVVPKEGRVERWSVLPDPDDLEEIEPAYLARAPFSVWKALLLGRLDPVEAVLKRRIALRGDLQPLLERVKYRAVAERVIARIETHFPDEP
jgi:putative sterol carrier protein